MKLSDEELMILEQVCYLDGDVGEAAGISGFSLGSSINKGQTTVKDILNQFMVKDEKGNIPIDKLDNGTNSISGARASEKEWAGVIKNIYSNDELNSLVISDIMRTTSGKIIGLTFTYPKDDKIDKMDKSAIVTFKGTTGKREWRDNIEGLNETDTECQGEALDYIESLPYDDIIVTGHSKGGNKAMYVTVNSDKISRCVSMDGQGFSPEFMEKYKVEISQKFDRITNYSLSTDFVHILMYQIPNSEQYYCIGDNLANAAEYHSPNSFFRTDDNGNIYLDGSKNPMIIANAKENPAMDNIRKFTTYIMANASEKEKDKIISYIADIVADAMCAGGDKELLMQDIFADSEALGLVLGYLFAYVEEYNLSTDELDGLLTAFGLKELDEYFCIEVFGFKIFGLSDLVKKLWELVADGKNLFLASNILGFVIDRLNLNIDYDAEEMLKVTSITLLKLNTNGVKPIPITDTLHKSGKTWDFSDKTYNQIINTINKIEKTTFEPLADWKKYNSQEWFSSLIINTAIKGISAYFERLSETNLECMRRVDKVFDNAKEIDKLYAKKIKEENEELIKFRNGLNKMSNKYV